MKKYVIIVVAVLCAEWAAAQSVDRDYRTAIGVKVWDGAGLSVKHFTSDVGALEGILYFWDEGFRLTGLYEFHGDIGGAPGLRWYIGPGAHLGFYDYNDDDNGNGNDNDGNDNDTYIGIDGVIGLDFKFNKVPINISLDWQPSFEFGDNRGFNGGWGGLGIRYAFGK
jgi:hypothetical protein